MFPRFTQFSLLGLLLLGSLAAQDVRVRKVAQVEMPQQIDSNSPAFWRDGKLFWYGSRGGPSLSQGPNQFGPWETTETRLSLPNPWPTWVESVWPEDNGPLLAWYHTEPTGLVDGTTLTAPKIGAAISWDGGKTLRDLGIVLESGDALDPHAKNGYFAGGHGDFSVIPDRSQSYIYFFFDNYGGTTSSQGVCVARMAYADRRNPEGKVWKYYNGGWQEAGVGGKVTPIFPVTRRWGASDPDALWGPAIHWNSYLNCYVMLLNHAQGEPGWSQEGVYVSFSTDLSRPELWTTPKKILGQEDFDGWYFFYPQVMGLEANGTDRQAGATARLYVGGVSRWEIDFIPPAGPPVIASEVTASPSADAAATKSAVTFSITATGRGPMSYQWYHDGVAIVGATRSTFTIPSVSEADGGNYSVSISNDYGTVMSRPLSLTVAPPPPERAEGLTNLSVRAAMAAGDAGVTVGFVLQGTESKQLLLRAIGPALANFGVAGSVTNPRLAIFDARGAKVAENDDWLPEDDDRFTAAGAFPLVSGSADAAVIVSLPPGAGSAQASSQGDAGLALVEIYDAQPFARSKIVNVSTRAWVGSGDQTLVGGFELTGTGNKQILIRAIGPGLTAFGVADALVDPIVELYNADAVKLAENDNWSDDLTKTFETTGASRLLSGSRDAALVASLPAGKTYTAVVRGHSNQSGEVLLEMYEVQ